MSEEENWGAVFRWLLTLHCNVLSLTKPLILESWYFTPKHKTVASNPGKGKN